MLTHPKTCAFALALFLLGVTGAESAYASLIFDVNVDTSSVSGQSGFLDFQFNPGDSSALSATATLTLFETGGGILAQPALLTGDAAGSLPGTLTLDNDTVYNDAFQAFTFGDSFSFTVTLSGPAIGTPDGTYGSAFAISLYAADGFTPLLTTDPNGSVSTIDLSATGTASVFTFPQSATDNTPAAAVILLNVVPEPSTLTLALICSSLQVTSILFCRVLRRGYSCNFAH